MKKKKIKWSGTLNCPYCKELIEVEAGYEIIKAAVQAEKEDYAIAKKIPQTTLKD